MFLPPLEMRPSSVAQTPAESRETPLTPQHPSPLRGTLGSSLRSPAEFEGNKGFPPPFEMKPSSIGPNPVESLRLRQLHSIPHLSEAPWEVP